MLDLNNNLNMKVNKLQKKWRHQNKKETLKKIIRDFKEVKNE